MNFQTKVKLMITETDEDTELEEDYLDEMIPKDVSEEVAALLGEEVLPFNDHLDVTGKLFATHLLNIWETSLQENGEVDYVKYSEDLEALAYRLYEQRNFLLMVIANNQNKTKMIPQGMWVTHDLINKFVIYAMTGVDLSVVGAPRKIYTMNQFESLLVAFEHLPEEWKPRAAQFIQIYSSNFFETEFATG